MPAPNIRVIHSARAVTSALTRIGGDRVEISPEAGRLFDSLQRRVAGIAPTMLANSATAVSARHADAVLADIEQLAREARQALAVTS